MESTAEPASVSGSLTTGEGSAPGPFAGRSSLLICTPVLTYEERVTKRRDRAAQNGCYRGVSRRSIVGAASDPHQALHRGNQALARASRRRLERLTPWVPERFPLLDEFNELVSARTPVAPRPDALRGRARSGGGKEGLTR